MKTSVGRGANERPAQMLALLCIRSLRCRISSSGVMCRIGGLGLSAAMAREKVRCLRIPRREGCQVFEYWYSWLSQKLPKSGSSFCALRYGSIFSF
jgi:hypothetical protein